MPEETGRPHRPDGQKSVRRNTARNTFGPTGVSDQDARGARPWPGQGQPTPGP